MLIISGSLRVTFLFFGLVAWDPLEKKLRISLILITSSDDFNLCKHQ